MTVKSLPQKIRQEITSFLTEVAKSNETIYLILLTLYVAISVELKMIFRGKTITYVERTRYVVLGIVMWGTALYLFFIIAAWKKLWNDTFWLILIGGMLLFFVGFFSRKMSTNAYGVVFDIAFCILACGKSFRKMLKCILGCVVAGLIIAGIGVPLRFTKDLGKPHTTMPGHSLGINYPNTWAYMVFLALLLMWYLYLRNRPLLTFALYWASAVFNWTYIRCRTIAGLAVLFPFCALLIDLYEKRADRKASEGTFKRIKPLEWIITAIPFIAFAVMLGLSMAVEWMHQYYHGPIRTLAWRFIQGGLYFRTYGFPIFGNPYRSNVYTYVNVNGEFIKVGILDSSFAAYIIMRGMVWLFMVLIWLCIAHWKALKKRDYAIIFLEIIILGFAMMERPGLEMWYNFILLYPLAKVLNKPKTEHVLEFLTENGTPVGDSADGRTESEIESEDGETVGEAVREGADGEIESVDGETVGEAVHVGADGDSESVKVETEVIADTSEDTDGENVSAAVGSTEGIDDTGRVIETLAEDKTEADIIRSGENAADSEEGAVASPEGESGAEEKTAHSDESNGNAVDNALITAKLDISHYLKMCLAGVLNVFLAVILGVVLLCGAFALPQKPIEKHLENSSTTIQEEGVYTVVSKMFSSTLDNFTDSLMLLEAGNDKEAPILERAVSGFSGKISKYNPAEILVLHFGNHMEYDRIVPYYRYWHGFLTVLRPLLIFMDYHSIRILNGVVQVLLLIATIYLMSKRKKDYFMIPWLLGYLMLMPIVLAKSMQYSSCYYMFMIGSLALLMMNSGQLKKYGALVFLNIGIFTAYFDFLTYPIATFGVPMLVFLMLVDSDDLKAKAINTVRNGALWCIGYGGMWVSKWILTGLVTGSNVMAEGVNNVAKRTSDYVNEGAVQLDKGTVVQYNIKEFLTTPVKYFAIVVIAFFIYEIIRNRKSITANALLRMLPYLIVGLSPIVWYVFATNHSAQHLFFTNKASVVAFLAVMFSLADLAQTTALKSKEPPEDTDAGTKDL